MTRRSWYRIVNAADGATADLYVFDAIGASFWNDHAVTAKSFIDAIHALPDSVQTLRVHVNSPGGDPFDATAIANALRAQRTEKGRTVEVSIEGLAASAATIVTSAGSPIRIADNALFMIHDPAGLVMGPSVEMRKMADLLDTVRSAIIATYRWVSALSVEELTALMAATTWMDAKTAVEHGFATEVVEGMAVTASLRPEMLAKLGEVPDEYRARVEALLVKPESPKPEPKKPEPPAAASAKDVLARCRAAGFLELAEPLIDAGATLETVVARLTTAAEIRAICATAQFPAMASGYIQSETPTAVVRDQLTMLTAKFDAIELDGKLPVDPERVAAQRRALNPAAIYAARNQRGN